VEKAKGGLALTSRAAHAAMYDAQHLCMAL
jgi:hypothetical protein